MKTLFTSSAKVITLVTLLLTASMSWAQRELLFVVPDHLGTPQVITDSNQNVVWENRNPQPFGAGTPNQDPDGDGRQVVFDLRFPGQYFDEESNLHYNWFRYYDPNTGRYLRSDPIGLRGGINAYAYVGGNPLTYYDPNGQYALPAAVAACAASPACVAAVAATLYAVGNSLYNIYDVLSANGGDDDNVIPFPPPSEPFPDAEGIEEIGDDELGDDIGDIPRIPCYLLTHFYVGEIKYCSYMCGSAVRNLPAISPECGEDNDDCPEIIY